MGTVNHVYPLNKNNYSSLSFPVKSRQEVGRKKKRKRFLTSGFKSPGLKFLTLCPLPRVFTAHKSKHAPTCSHRGSQERLSISIPWGLFFPAFIAGLEPGPADYSLIIPLNFKKEELKNSKMWKYNKWNGILDLFFVFFVHSSENIKCLIKACKVKKATTLGHFSLHSYTVQWHVLFILAKRWCDVFRKLRKSLF